MIFLTTAMRYLSLSCHVIIVRLWRDCEIFSGWPGDAERVHATTGL